MGKIKAAGLPTTTAFIVTNPDEFSEVKVLKTGAMEKLTAILKEG